MAVSIQELIDRQEAIKAKKNERYDLETSQGTMTVKKPSRSFVAEALAMQDGEGDKYMILNMVVEPSLKDSTLQQAYGCKEPTDIVTELFDSGEIVALAKAIMACAGYGKDIKKELHEEAKN